MANRSNKEDRGRSWIRPARIAVTVLAISLAAFHFIFPAAPIDAITLGLLAVALVPWLAPLIKTLELPGGVKVELRDLEKASDQVDQAGLLTAGTPPKADHSFQLIADRDPNLALAGLRIEIERRLLRIAEAHKIPTKSKGINKLLIDLRVHDLITDEQSHALDDMLQLLNEAVHGASVDPKAASWAMGIGPALLESLDRLIGPSDPKIFVQPEEPKFAKEGDLWIY